MHSLWKVAKEFRCHHAKFLNQLGLSKYLTVPSANLVQKGTTIHRVIFSQQTFGRVHANSQCRLKRLSYKAETSNDEEDEGEEDNESAGESSRGIVLAHKKNKVPMWEVCVGSNHFDVIRALEQWLSQGNVINRPEVVATFRMLKRRKLFRRAVNISSWILKKSFFEFDESYYASHLDCLFKGYGSLQAERYFANTIPSSMKGIAAHRILLTNYAVRKNATAAQNLFWKMKELGFKLDVSDYNFVLLVYQRCHRDDVPKILKLMDDENIKPNEMTFKILIAYKSSIGDTLGMEEIVEKTKDLKDYADILLKLAREYIRSAMEEKAEMTLIDFEKNLELDKETPGQKHYIFRKLVWLYSLLGKENDVQRYWEELMHVGDLYLKDYVAGILAWGKLGNIIMSEHLFESMLQSKHKILAKHYNSLLHVYATHGMLHKAEDLVMSMSSNGVSVNRSIRSSLIRLYLNLGDMKKAEFMLTDNYGGSKMKPAFQTMLAVLKKYVEKGEIDNAERVFDKMRRMGYKRRTPMYKHLIRAYLDANASSYRLRLKMRADRFIPDRNICELLQKLAP